MEEPKELELTGPDGVTEIIDLAKAPVVNNPSCEHRFMPDPTDETDDFIAYVCIKQKCGMGYLVRKR